MTARHFEVVRTDADQPWHVRLVQGGKIVLDSEGYTRMVGAERAIIAAARTFGWEPTLSVNVPGAPGHIAIEKVVADQIDTTRPAISIRYVDERAAVAR